MSDNNVNDKHYGTFPYEYHPTATTSYNDLSVLPSIVGITSATNSKYFMTARSTNENETIFDNTTVIKEQSNDFYSDDQLFLTLRYYARHFIPIFCLVGIIGNCMALMLIRTNYWLRRLTSNIYLCTLSICGCLFLSTVMLTWLDSTFSDDFPIYSNSLIGCKILTFMAHSCDFICVWMISWVSIDRGIVLFRPGIRRRVCNKKFARNLVICTVLFSSTLYGWCLVFAGLEPTADGSSYCGLNSGVQLGEYNLRELHIFFSLLDTILCTVVPSFLIMVVNSLSIYRYRQCMKIYASGVLRVRFLRVPDGAENHNQTQQNVTEEQTTKNFLLSQQSQLTTNHNQTISLNHMSNQTTASSRSTGGKLKSSDLTLSRSLLIVTRQCLSLAIIRSFPFSDVNITVEEKNRTSLQVALL